ncbi:sensor histidine kinase [Ponticoccus alexandrii]|uniref:histidine kinase n=1 Tax=Ponticoccus alexandrii TaxID=1943633 RepID=A0ABX7F605_9RHOB|nr:hybrid sensor histidine kinase/response regulator [Ponticoccus alexandrii]QRF65636.1 response regulator [Ponticoccus alexandrii]
MTPPHGSLETGPDRPIIILIIDDDTGDTKLLCRALDDSGLSCDLRRAPSMQAALDGHGEEAIDLVFLDYGLPNADGLANIATVLGQWPEAAVAVVTGQGDEVIAAAAIKSGAIDYIPKRNIAAASLRRLVQNGLEVTRLRHQIEAQRQELDTFAHTLAHDLKAPLRALDYFTLSLAEGIAAGDTQAMEADRTEIAGLVARLHRTIDTLSAHLHPGQGAAHGPEPADALLRAAAANLRAEIAESGAALRAGPLPVVLCADTEVIQLLQNLIGNGIKYCRDHPPDIHVSAVPTNAGRWIFSVRDNGIGIAPEHAEQVFQPFRRLHREEEIPGTGLGLATCAKIVRRHGGRIWCEPQPQGTLFRFTLPAAPEPP